MRIKGISGSRGIAVGNVYKYIQEEIVIPDYIVPEGGVDQEIAKFAGAMAATLKQLDNIERKPSMKWGRRRLLFSRRICKLPKIHLCLMASKRL